MLAGLLPIGSVVTLRDVELKVMVVGYMPKDLDNPEREHEYSGLFYPLGFRAIDQFVQFDMNQVISIDYIGYQDREQMEFEEYILGLNDGDEDEESDSSEQEDSRESEDSLEPKEDE